jgi:hypothetical protein
MIREQEYDYIIAFVEKGHFKNAALQNDLIDHYCCLIEEKVTQGLTFQKAFEEAYQQISPNGLKEIEIETNFLINYRKFTLMKKLIFTIGFVSAFAASLGSFLKIMDMPGGNVLAFSGFIGLAYLFIPSLIYLQYKSNKLNTLRDRLKWIIGGISLILITTGAIFKVLHLQGAAVVFGVGMLTFAFAFLPILFFSMFKESQNEMISQG